MNAVASLMKINAHREAADTMTANVITVGANVRVERIGGQFAVLQQIP
jgi:hypothetical protein